MATGRLGKFYKENCLVDQAFIKDGNMDVNAYVNATAKKLGGDIKIVEYTHFIKGEGWKSALTISLLKLPSLLRVN